MADLEGIRKLEAIVAADVSVLWREPFTPREAQL